MEKGLTMKTINLLIGGEAGQGLVTIGQLLSKTLIKTGYDILVSQSYHSRIRGGHNTFAIRIGVQLRRVGQADAIVTRIANTIVNSAFIEAFSGPMELPSPKTSSVTP